MNREKASCYCGNITAEVVLSKPLSEFLPRACDCDFCTKHGAAYLSDPEGCLTIRISRSEDAIAYNQGSGIADFWICGKCGILVAVTYSHQPVSIGTLNANTLANRSTLKPAQIVSPKLLSSDDKKSRWQQVWFQNIEIEFDYDKTPD